MLQLMVLTVNKEIANNNYWYGWNIKTNGGSKLNDSPGDFLNLATWKKIDQSLTLIEGLRAKPVVPLVFRKQKKQKEPINQGDVFPQSRSIEKEGLRYFL